MANPVPQSNCVGSEATTTSYPPFISDKELEESRDFDYVVIGASFCALAFIRGVLKNNPLAKILIIERGDYIPPEYFETRTPLELGREEKENERIYWNVSPRTQDGEHITSLRGMNIFFGGRSCFWKAWCPKPTKEEMAEWPEEVIENVDKCFPAAKELLNVQPVNEIREFGQLQTTTYRALKSAVDSIEAISRVEHTPLAVSVSVDACRYSCSKDNDRIVTLNIFVGHFGVYYLLHVPGSCQFKQGVGN